MPLKITEEDAETILFELELDTPNTWYEEEDKFILREKSNWTGGKYQQCYAIFSKVGSMEMYRLVATRTGSHYTEWYRTYELNCPRVERKEVVTYEYVDCDPS